MMVFALSVVRGHVQQRIADAVAGLGPDPSPRDLLRTAIVEMLPLDGARRSDGRVGLMFVAYFAVRPDAATLLHDDIASTLDFMAAQIRTAQQAGRANTAIEPDQAAIALLAIAEGMNYYLIGGHYDAATALATLDAQLDLIFSS